MRRVTHFLGEFGVSLLLLPLLLAVFFLWAVGTTQGSRWTVEQLLENTRLPIEIRGFSGRLIDRIHIEQLTYQLKNGQLEIAQATITYNPLKLARRQLFINSLSARQVTLTQYETPDPAEKTDINKTLERWSSPVSISLNKLEIDKFDYKKGEREITLREIQSQVVLQNKRLSLSPLAFSFKEHDITLQGELQLAPDIPFDLAIKTQTRELANLNLSAKGSLTEYRAEGRFELNKPNLPPADGEFTGKGNARQITLDTWNATLLNGRAKGAAVISWSPELNVDLQYQATGLEAEQLPGNLELKTDLNGELKYSKQILNFTSSANGKYRDLPMTGQANGTFHDGVLVLNNASIENNLNRLEASGSISRSQEFDLQFSADIPQPGEFVTELGGSIQGDGHIIGSAAAPGINLNFKLQDFSFKESFVKNATITISPSENKTNHDIRIHARDLVASNQAVKQIQLAAQTDFESFTGTAQVAGAPQSLAGRLEINGQIDRSTGTWSGQLLNTKVMSDKLPEFQQASEVQWVVSREETKLTPVCLKRRDAEVCAELTRRGKQELDTRVSTQSFPTEYLVSWVPELKGLNEKLDAELSLKITNDQQAGNFNLQLDDNNRLNIVLNRDLSSDKINGAVTGRFNKVDWINLFTDEIINPRGTLQTELSLSGTSASPSLSGFLRFTDGSARLPTPGVQLKQVSLDVQVLTAKSAKISGQMLSGQGKLAVKGDLSWERIKDWKLVLRLSGSNFEAVNQPAAKVLIDPKLQIWASREGAAIQGSVTVPEAKIELANLPANAVRVSADEIIVDEPGKNSNKHYPTHTVVQVKLGENVRLSGYGLDARFEGKLKLIQHANKSIVADGVLKIAEGSYTAYGQNLTTEFGQIYFNGPLNSPRLNLLASRKIDNITAGIRIVGTLDAPESHVYSIPVMPQTDALSYLLTGKPLRATGKGEADILVNAAIRLGLKGSAGVINDIRSFAGLDTLEIQPGEDLEQSALIIGKYLTADLYLEYISQLFQGTDVILMRYNINDKLQLKAESSDTSKSIDLLYQFEKH
ncbi:MAG: translocation/assembly module TamB domain-containing protein [Thiotrichales bacterium]